LTVHVWRWACRRFDKGQQHKSWKAKGAAPVKGGELKTKLQVSKDRQKKVGGSCFAGTSMLGWQAGAKAARTSRAQSSIALNFFGAEQGTAAMHALSHCVLRHKVVAICIACHAGHPLSGPLCCS